MSTNVIEYRTRPERADENERLVREVFDELASTQPEGLRYRCLRLEDATFIHILEIADHADETGLTSLESFGRFADTVAGRAEAAPQRRTARTVGAYGHDRRTTADLATVEELCRMQIVARTLGCRVVVHDASESLRDLITFTGLGHALLPPSPAEGHDGDVGDR